MDDKAVIVSSEPDENDYSNSGNKRFKTCDSDSDTMDDDGNANTSNIESVNVNTRLSLGEDTTNQSPSLSLNADNVPLADDEMYVCDSQSETNTPTHTADTPNCVIAQEISVDMKESDICIGDNKALSENIINEDNSETELKIDENIPVDSSISLDTNIAHSSKVFPSGIPTDQSHTSLKQQSLEKRECQFSNYHLKWFDWKGEQTPIVTQNENGPCPLLAIANVLILARKINLPKMQQLISGKQLMEYIGDCILAETPKQEGNEELLLNYEQNMQDAIDIMHKLQTGIDVNVKFSGVTDFEFTPECIVFDLLKIQLYHGWLVDPQDTVHMEAVGGLGYNQLVEKMLLSKDAEGDKVLEGMVIEEFLARTASQLTYHGLCELNETIQEEELCVFFRNNHFSTLYKHKGELFLLVTDQGFLTELAVIWETLVNIEGDGQFVNHKFLSVNVQNEDVKTHSDNIGERTMSQEDRDYLIALSLQQDVPTHESDDNITNSIDRDHKLALKLQEEEDRIAQQQQQQQQPQVNQQQQPKQKNAAPTPQQQMQPPQQSPQQSQPQQIGYHQQQQQQQQHQQQQQQPATSQSANLRFSQQAGSANVGVSATRGHSQQQQQQQQQQQTGNSQQQQDRDKGCSIL